MLKRRDISERRACELVGISRSSYRYQPHPRDDSDLVERLTEIAAEHKKWDYRLAWGMLRNEGRKVKIKRVRRIWQQEGLQQPRKAASQAPHRGGPYPGGGATSGPRVDLRVHP